MGPFQLEAPAFQREKFAELVVMVARLTQADAHCGRTKFNKLLFFIDFTAFRRLGQSVTGATYKHRDFGPCAAELKNVEEQLVRDQALARSTASQGGYAQKRLLATRDEDATLFEDEELELVREIVQAHWNMTGAEIRDLSHERVGKNGPLYVGWQVTNDGETIPYEAVYARPPLKQQDLTAFEVSHGLALAEKYGPF